jgi:hypothetical protein
MLNQGMEEGWRIARAGIGRAQVVSRLEQERKRVSMKFKTVKDCALKLEGGKMERVRWPAKRRKALSADDDCSAPCGMSWCW